MTREEAITALGDRNHLLWGMSKEEKKYYSEAFDMAISALAADGEYIKKSELFDKTVRRNSIWNEVTNSEGKGLEEIVNDLPTYSFPDSALKGEWIPVSERLPEEREWYLAVFREKDTDFQLIPRVADYIGHGENRWQLINEEGLTQEYLNLLECVAWQPLPEPYKKGE